MTITISPQAYDELFGQVDEAGRRVDPSDPLDVFWNYPEVLGKGGWREIRLREGLLLEISSHELHDDLVMHIGEREHPLECIFQLSGKNQEETPETATNQLITAGQYQFFGSGRAPREIGTDSATEPLANINVHIEPELLHSFIGDPQGQLPPALQHLIKSPEQRYHNRVGTTTPRMQHVLQQILNCPYQGLTKRLYLESKVLELMALLLEHEAGIQIGDRPPTSLKPGTLQRIHYAREILRQRFTDPPSLEELAKQIKLNEYMLKRGFREVFGTTVFGYLHNYRMEQARQLLETGSMKVAEVAQAVGFADRSAFAAAFRKKFRVNPREYLKQCKFIV